MLTKLCIFEGTDGVNAWFNKTHTYGKTVYMIYIFLVLDYLQSNLSPS